MSTPRRTALLATLLAGLLAGLLAACGSAPLEVARLMRDDINQKKRAT